MTIGVFIADDHAIVRDGLRALLKDQNDIEVVGDASNGREAVHMMLRSCADIAIVDIAMPELNGIEAAGKILSVCPAVGIIILSMYATNEYIFRALQVGARGYLLKESAGLEVIDAIRTVRAGDYYLSRKISENILHDYLHKRRACEVKGPLARLSPREREILQLVVEGKSSAAIAAILGLSPKTVETYRSRLMAKLGVINLAALIKFAIQHGLTPP